MNKFASENYQGDKGKDYFLYQNKGGLQRGLINARKFENFVNPTDVVLDFGCGNGSLLYNLNCRKRIGVEINPAAQSEAKQLGIEVYSSLKQIEDDSIDLVISNHALEHVLCPLLVLKEIHKKLLSKGRLVLCLPIDDWRKQVKFNLRDQNHHLYTWTPQLIGNLLLEAGYKNIEPRIYTHAWPPKNWEKLDRYLPTWLFDLICWATSIRFMRRQIIVYAER